jgi:nicotinamide-nucleotide amidase
LAKTLVKNGWKLGVAESCTGGLLAAACTARAGSSLWFERGFDTYSNEAKMELLGVPSALLARHGAVSEPVACAMVRGVLQRAPVQVAVAITGIAGPGGGTAEKPIGTVWVAWGVQGHISTGQLALHGSRHAIRRDTVRRALNGLLERL